LLVELIDRQIPEVRPVRERRSPTKKREEIEGWAALCDNNNNLNLQLQL
jgi:hypothetical protein